MMATFVDDRATFEVWPLEKIRIDLDYQRQLQNHRIEVISKSWDDEICDPPVLSLRSDGAAYVVDGQHRVESAKRAGKKSLVCRILRELSRAREAELFAALNTYRKPAIIAERFKALVMAKDPAALSLVKVCHDLELKLAGYDPVSTGGSTENVIGCLGLLFLDIRQKGAAHVSRVLTTLKLSFEGESGSLTNHPYRAVSIMMVFHGDSINDNVLVAALEKLNIRRVIRKATGQADARGASPSIYLRKAFIKAYNAMNPKKKLKDSFYSRRELDAQREGESEKNKRS